jgi:hypothetical protein
MIYEAHRPYSSRPQEEKKDSIQKLKGHGLLAALLGIADMPILFLAPDSELISALTFTALGLGGLAAWTRIETQRIKHERNDW